MSIKFQALVLEQEDRQTLAEVRELSTDDLPEQELLVRVHYSTLNYKDALAITGKGRVIRRFPIVPGIDLAGEVVDPGNSAFKTGDLLISTGWGMGEEHWGAGTICQARSFMAPACARGAGHALGHDHGYRRFYRGTLCIGAPASRRQPAGRAGSGYRCGRRCGRCFCNAAGQTRI